MEKRIALLVCNEGLFTDITKYTLEKMLCEVEIVDNPRDAVNRVESNNYTIVLIGENKGTVVKHKLAEIIYNKSVRKPHIVIFKKAGEAIPKEFYITVIPIPNFHEVLLEVLEREGLSVKQVYQLDHIDLSSYIKFPNFKRMKIVDFFKNLKGNVKFHIKNENNEILGFTMGADIFVLRSTLDNLYSILYLHDIEVAIEPLSLNEFLSLTLDTKTFKSNFRDFIVSSISNLNDKGKLLSILPQENSIVTLKAPPYIVKQIDIINQNINIDKLHASETHYTIEDLINGRHDLNKIKALACMYILNMIDAEKPIASKKYDVKIKKSFLKKIIDKIRGL